MEKRDKFFIGVNALIIRDNKILFGKRKSVFGDGEWGLPGGHLEDKENMKQATSREILEETGVKCNSISFSNVFNNIQGDKHYLQFGFVVNDFEEEAKIMEPDKCSEWKWFDLNNLPDKIFEPHKPNIDSYLKNNHFTDSNI